MSLELNKVAAAVLTAGIVAMGSGFVAEVVFHKEAPEEDAFPIQVAAEGEEGGAAAGGPSAPQSILPLIAKADPAAGEATTRACAACHSFDQGGPHKVGPNLYAIVGAQIAGADGFSYSDALNGMSDQAWTYENLDGFLKNPKEWAPGTKMSYAGISDAKKRAELIAWMRENDDDPIPLPSEEELAAAGGGDQAAEGDAAEASDGEAAADGGEGQGAGGIEAMIAEAPASDGEAAARACQACHSFDQGGPNKVGPNLYDVVGAPIAAVEGFSYSNALKSMESQNWNYENLWKFLENPRGFAEGTKMSFAGVKDEAKRAAIISYMRAQSEDPPPLGE